MPQKTPVFPDSRLRRATAAVVRALEAGFPHPSTPQVHATPSGRVYEVSLVSRGGRSGMTYDSSTDTPHILGAATRAVRAFGTPRFAGCVQSLARTLYGPPATTGAASGI